VANSIVIILIFFVSPKKEILEIQVSLETASYAKRKKLFEHLKAVSGIELDVNELGSATENFTLNEFFILS